MKRFQVSAPGKFHFSGEHSVVYGHPALLAAVDLRCWARGGQRAGKSFEFINVQTKKERSLSYKEIAEYAEKIRTGWQSWLSGGSNDYRQWLVEDEWGLVKVAVGEAYRLLAKKPAQGWKIEIDSALPVGSGLGSSAALAAALGGLVWLGETNKLDKEMINKIAFETEKRQHGRPSGGDNTTVVYGGMQIFQKKEDQAEIKTAAVNIRLDQYWLANTGRSVESTGEMVSLVREKYEKETRMGAIIAKLGAVTREMIEAFGLGDEERIRELIKDNERLLEEMGVVGKKAKELIRKIEKQGGTAKICGAGGFKSGSGMMFVASMSKEEMEDFANKNKLEIYKVKLGEGLRNETAN